MTAQASVSAQTIRSPRIERESLPYELKIQEKLAQVQALVAFVEQEHFTLSTVYAYLQQEKRAVLAVRNIARILGYELDEYIGETHQLLSESEASDLYQFTEAFAPPLFDIINSIGPNRDYISDMRTHVEELQYATEARQALLQYLLISYNARYQRANLFGNLMEASKWTAMYSRNLDTADEIIHQTRGLLVAQKNAVRDYLNFITQEIREIADLAEARYRVVKPIAYMQTIEAAENRIIHILGERSQAYETLNLSALTPQQRSSRFSGLAKHVIRRAPKLAIFLMGLAAAGGGLFAFLRPQTAPATAAAAVPEPIRGTADSTDTARFTTLNTGNFTARSAQMLQDIASTLTGSQSQTATVAAPAPVVTAETQKIADFFATLSPNSGKNTLVLGNASELGAFIAYLQSHNYYSEADVLSLFNLSSVTEFTHSLVVDVRHGTVKPMLFPYNEANSNLTAPMTVIPGANPIGTGLVSLVTAAFSDVNANTAPMATLQPGEAFIVYRVQGGDTLEAIANRYGTTVTQIQSDNILNTDSINRGQTLQIRRPASTTDNRTAPFSIGLWNTTTKNRTAMGVVPKLTSISNEIVSRYYTQLFPSLDAMPADARDYVVATVDEVASFFNVRPQDVLGILKQEQNNAGFRLYEDRVSSAGAVGIAQIIPQTWNGWKGSNGASFASSMADIERDGGIGFDWAARETWRMVQQGIMPASALANTNADPTVFENAIAGVARHLSQYGVTSQLAEQDPAQYEQRLADAIAIYNSGRPLSESSDFVQSAENHSTTGAYVAQAMETSNEVAGAFQQVATTAPVTSASLTPTVALEQRYSTKFREMFDEDFGIQLSDAELAGFLAANQTLLDDVRLGKVDPMLAGAQLIEQVELHYMREGREAIRNGDVRPWPYIHNTETLEAQRLAVTLMGRTLTLNEIDQLVVANNADINAMRTVLAGRAESKLFIQAQQSFDQMLQRSARGLNIYNYEVAAIVHPLLSGINLNGLDDTALRTMTAQVQSAIRALPEYQDLYGAREFKAMPFLPMPEVFKGFGVAVSYQAGGYHTGIDVTAPAENGQEPAIFAVDEGTVVHVGSLYCAQPDACRGGKAIVIDHGNNLYTLYSHNSEADVEVGQRVEAGQQIGRQGNEGYSFGSHLHFEVHTGAPWSGDWEKPFEGGSFVDPMEYLPR